MQVFLPNLKINYPFRKVQKSPRVRANGKDKYRFYTSSHSAEGTCMCVLSATKFNNCKVPKDLAECIQMHSAL